MKQQAKTAAEAISDRLANPVWSLLLLLTATAGVMIFSRRTLLPSETTSPIQHRHTTGTLPPDRAGGQVGIPAAQHPRSNLAEDLGRALLRRYQETVGGRLDDYTVNDLVFNLQDATLPWKVRRRVAWELAGRSTTEAMAALKKLADGAEPALKALIAEALGQSRHPDATPWLLALLHDRDATVAMGAIRGLAVLGNEKSMNALTALLFDPSQPANIRGTVILGLGDSNNPAAASILMQAFGQFPEREMQESLLGALGRQPLDATRGFFESLLTAPEVGPELRTAAVEALANNADEAAPLLLQSLRDREPAVRAAAAWALSMAESPGDWGNEFGTILAQEPNAGVRTRLYQALADQENFDFRAALPSVIAEQDPATRMAGLAAWAMACRSSLSPDIAQQFDQVAVPELRQAALAADDLGERLNAVIALRRAGTVGAGTALRDVASQATDPNVIQAAQAALGQEQLPGSSSTTQQPTKGRT